ncbi:T9SS type B sorting domain-containing protein, partial [Cyclobacterium salsum]|uniref:T9SS type B sorting domain-containing protein n=1 Tax=Cyclobacterium salsum TaxID=2666329 RepID=UPI001390A4A9
RQGNLSAGANYTLDFTAADFSINPQTLVLNANSGQNKVYGENDPALTFTSSGFVNGEDESLLSGSLNREIGEDVGAYAINQGSLSAGTNYQIQFSGDTFQILPRVKNSTLVLDESGKATLEPVSLLDQPLAAGQLVILDRVDFDCTTLGEQEIEVSVLDKNGNAFNSNALVNVEDQSAPLPSLASLPVLRAECALESWEPPTASDNCDGSIVGVPDKNLPIQENTLITWTFTDSNGNSSTQTQEVVIADVTAPVIESIPADQTIYLNGSYELPDFTEVAVARDNCELSRFVQLPAPGTQYSDAETILVQLTATDTDGNDKTASFEITLVNLNLVAIEDPELVTIPWNTPLESVSFPDKITVRLSNGQESSIPVSWTIPVLDTKVAGLYQYKGTPDVGNIQNPDGLEPILSILVEDKALPEGITLSTDEFAADSDPGTVIGSLNTLDPADNIHRYELTGSTMDNRYFGISGSDLFWNSQEALPGKTSFSLQVSSTDRAGNTIFQTFTLNRSRADLDAIFVPNSFTPNGDGVNDDWGVNDLRYYQDSKIAVYERSGKRIFYTENPNERWDGTYFGNELPTGTYFWVISLGETDEIRRGVLTIFND